MDPTHNQCPRKWYCGHLKCCKCDPPWKSDIFKKLKETGHLLAVGFDSAESSDSQNGTGCSTSERGERYCSMADAPAVTSSCRESLSSILTGVRDLHAFDHNWRLLDFGLHNFVTLGRDIIDVNFAGTSVRGQNLAIEPANKAVADQIRNLSTYSYYPSELSRWKQSFRDLPDATSINDVNSPRMTGSKRVGTNGPLLLQDSHLIDLLSHFDQERIPDRVVYAKDSGVNGIFTGTKTVDDLCLGDIFSQGGKQCHLTTRFSTVGGKSGSYDCARDPRGFSVKFKTKEGNWDMVANNNPVFFVRDPATSIDPEQRESLVVEHVCLDALDEVARGKMTVHFPFLSDLPLWLCAIISALRSVSHKTLRRLMAWLRGLSILVSPSSAILSPLLFTSRAMASPSTGTQTACGLSWLGVDWLHGVDHAQRQLISHWSRPFSAEQVNRNHPSVTQKLDPKTLLLATFICTSMIVVASQAGRHDIYQPLIVALFALLSGIWATIVNADIRQFILGYLFWGCFAGVGTSWLIHRVIRFGKPQGEDPANGHPSRAVLR